MTDLEVDGCRNLIPVKPSPDGWLLDGDSTDVLRRFEAFFDRKFKGKRTWKAADLLLADYGRARKEAIVEGRLKPGEMYLYRHDARYTEDPQREEFSVIIGELTAMQRLGTVALRMSAP